MGAKAKRFRLSIYYDFFSLLIIAFCGFPVYTKPKISENKIET